MISPCKSHQFSVTLNHPLRFTESELSFTMNTKRCSINLVDEIVFINVWDDPDGRVVEHILGFALNPADPWALSVTQMDEQGEVVKINRFDGIKLREHHATYDYGENEFVVHNLSIEYKHIDVLR
ncbi:MAG: hypothetical protein EOP83_06565 [Verrucomicrobiaceae bacterium]|nr:MAG: hypothetical protein EOP83_06565 [Verrucomicrobiaceae bacterium]